ncbi:ATP-binding protein [Halobaculum lipolyticum]|uniref:histidine kinase n=1 Tax=Halobaculum lipolyticum TaxID=3032001 RepID=A0ABD5WEF8_9EURY|nr:hybrid sensor histidine kinase/response regulator [Halobaculum sp. DT31]
MTSRSVEVLCVGDDAEVRDRVDARLSRALDGASVSTVTDAEEAERRLAAVDGAVDCVVSAYDLPDRDGLGLLTTVRDRWPELPFVLVADAGSERVAGEAVAEGVTAYVPLEGADPFDTLAARVRTALEERRDRSPTRSRAEQYRSLVGNADDAMAVLEDGRYRLVNEACADLLDRSMAEIVGATDRDLLPEPVATALASHSERAKREGEPVTQRLEVPTETRSRFFDIRHIPHEGARGEPGGVARVVREVSEQVERERLLREERDRLEALADAVAHDARNAIQLVAGRADLAREANGRDEAAVERNLDAIDNGVDRLYELVASLESLRGVSDPVTDPARVSIADAAAAAWATVDAPEAELRIAADPVVAGDPPRIRTLLENLLRNAVDHGGRDVTVTVDTVDDGRGFAVADDGPGVPVGERERILEFGYGSGPGTGIGLGIVAGIAEAHGWSVRVTGSADGGARFEFRQETIDSFVS